MQWCRCRSAWMRLRLPFRISLTGTLLRVQRRAYRRHLVSQSRRLYRSAREVGCSDVIACPTRSTPCVLIPRLLLIRACLTGEQVRLGSVWGGIPSHDLLVPLSLPHRPSFVIYLLYLRALKASEASFFSRSSSLVRLSRRDKRVSLLRTRRHPHKIFQTLPP